MTKRKRKRRPLGVRKQELAQIQYMDVTLKDGESWGEWTQPHHVFMSPVKRG